MGRKASVTEVCGECGKTKHTVSTHVKSGRRMCAVCRGLLTTPRPPLVDTASLVTENQQLRSAVHMQQLQLSAQHLQLSAQHQQAVQCHASMQLLQLTLGKSRQDLVLQCAVTHSMKGEKGALAKALQAATVSNDDQKATITSAHETVKAIELVRDQLQDEVQDMRRENARLLYDGRETAARTATTVRALQEANEQFETHNRKLLSQLGSKPRASPPAMTKEQRTRAFKSAALARENEELLQARVASLEEVAPRNDAELQVLKLYRAYMDTHPKDDMASLCLTALNTHLKPDLFFDEAPYLVGLSAGRVRAVSRIC